MTNKALNGLRWCTAIATVLMLLVFAWACVDIYLTGNRAANLDENGVHIHSVYSREIVIERLQELSIPMIAYAALLMIAGIAHLAWHNSVVTRGEKEMENRLRLKKARMAVLPESVQQEEKRRHIIHTAMAMLLVLCALPCLTYLLNQEHFTSWDLERVMGDMMLHVTPWGVVGFFVAVVASSLCKRSRQREWNLLRDAAAGEAQQPAVAKRKSAVPAARIALYAVAVVFIVLGVMNGGLRDVLVKAINICTECIGLG